MLSKKLEEFEKSYALILGKKLSICHKTAVDITQNLIEEGFKSLMEARAKWISGELK